MNRLVVYELRRLVDTRASLVLLAICLAAGIGLGLLSTLIHVQAGIVEISDVGTGVVLPFALIAPVFGVLAATSDWQNVAIQQTFLIEQRRGRIFFAKGLAGMLTAAGSCVLAVILAVPVAAVVVAVRGDSLQLGDLGATFRQIPVIVLFSTWLGFGLGALLQSTAAGIAAIFTVEFVVDIALVAIPHGIGAYFQSASLQNWVTSEGTALTGLSSLALWYVVPVAVGWLRFTHREVSV